MIDHINGCIKRWILNNKTQPKKPLGNYKQRRNSSTKNSYKTSTDNIIFNGEKPEAFALRSDTRQ